MATDYRDYQAGLAPTFLGNTWGQAWMRNLASVKQTLVDRMKQGVKARMPLICPPDALAAIGRERSIIRGILESDSSYAQRVCNAWTAWPWAGTAYGILQQLYGAGYPNPLLLQVRQYGFNLDSNQNLVVTTLGGNGWSAASVGNQGFWSKFYVLFPYPLLPRWLASTTAMGSVFHAGTGTGTVSVSSVSLTGDMRIVVYITNSGATGAGGCKISMDGGVTTAYSGVIPASTTLSNFAGNITLSLSGTFTAFDGYTIAPTWSIPVDGSTESSIVKLIVNTWKPAKATVGRYIIHTSGNVYGWPVGDKYGLPPTGGTSGGYPLYYGGSSATYWSP